ncbi:BglG family transcription antiterminator [Terribacillus aidingensis]|uniref:BglG family transcription antiterminator n=1 Tax=Terribacillus aidingensis TaxID=586416 RepID=UPI003450747E
MMLDKRPSILLEQLIRSQHITLQQLMDLTHLSKRQLTYDLEKLNDWLTAEQLPQILYKGTQLIRVPQEVVQCYQKKQLIQNGQQLLLTEEDRLLFLYLYLFIRTEPVSSYHLTHLLQVSKNTVVADIKRANKLINPSLVEIRYTRQNGYHLRGSEADKRIVVQNHLAKILQNPAFPTIMEHLTAHLKNVTAGDVQALLQTMEKDIGLQFVEERLDHFTYFLVLLACRLREGKTVRFHEDEILNMKQDPMWDVALSVFEKLQLPLDEHEVCYFSIHLLALSLGQIQQESNTRDLLYKLCEQLVLDFENKAAVVFERRANVVRTLYQHMRPAYYRMKYRIPIHNPLLQQIKNEHEELYLIVQELLQPVGDLLNIVIPEEELGFITIHFGALLEKPTQQMPRKKRALVVCPSGISSSLMVKYMLESLFSEIVVEDTCSLRQFEQKTEMDFDVIFSTIDLQASIPCFHVKPIMSPTEKSSLVNGVYETLFGIQYSGVSVRELLQEISRYATIHDEKQLENMLRTLQFHRKTERRKENQPVLQDLLYEDTIQLAESLPNWQDAITCVAKPLLQNKSISPSYVEAMIENIEKLGPYVVIGPDVAIPHARPESGVHAVGMSFLRLKEPVYFSADRTKGVRLLFCIAAIDNKTHLRALSQLTKLLSDKENVTTLIESDSKEEILALFKSYSTIA